MLKATRNKTFAKSLSKFLGKEFASSEAADGFLVAEDHNLVAVAHR